MNKGILTVLMGMFAAYALAGRITPEQFIYMGAFRLPDTEPYESGWYWGGTAMTYYPYGDTSGTKDGYPGSIYGTGHAWNMYVCEVDIPEPVVSTTKDLNDLNTSGILQNFTDVRGTLFTNAVGEPLFDEMMRAGIEYLPAQGSQLSDKLHLSWGQHLQEGAFSPSHMWCELDLAHPESQGPWYFNGYSNYTSCDYLFEIPASWADSISNGYRLAAGRFRDGLWSGRGPALYAFRPWQTDVHSGGDTLSAIVPLLLYGEVQEEIQHIYSDQTMCMNGFREADEWVGGAWLTYGEDSAVILAGTKGTGHSWYGLPDGTVWDEEDTGQEDPYNQRGWWCDGFKGLILFFDPSDFLRVVRGEMQHFEVQPYDSLNIDPLLFAVDSVQQKSHVCGVCYDRLRNYLYIGEWLADDDKPLIHVWKIGTGQGSGIQKTMPEHPRLLQNYPNPFNAETLIEYSLREKARIIIDIFNLRGQIIRSMEPGMQSAGRHHILWNSLNRYGQSAVSGVYVVRLKAFAAESGRTCFQCCRKITMIK